MNNTIQLYIDEENDIKGYPITSFDRVINEHGNNLQEELDNNTIKFDVIGEGIEAPPINGGGSYDDSELVERLDTIDAQINNIVNLNRKFVPKLDRSFIFGHVTNENGGYNSKSNTEIKNELYNIKQLNFDGVHLILHIGINKNNKKLFVAGSSDYQNTINYIYETCCECGLELRSLKLHCEQPGTQLKLETIQSNCGLDNFKQQYLLLLREIASNNKSITKNIIVLNELTYFYTNNKYFEFCNECINIVKSNEYNVSISCISPNDMLLMNDQLKKAVSFFSINHYPTLSYNGLKLNISKAVLAYCFESNLFQCIEHLQKQYNKPIHITETGSMDIEEALAKP